MHHFSQLYTYVFVHYYLCAEGFSIYNSCRCPMHCFKWCHLEKGVELLVYICFSVGLLYCSCIVLLQNVDCNLWTAKLFPVCSSRKESCAATIEIIKSVQEKCLHKILCMWALCSHNYACVYLVYMVLASNPSLTAYIFVENYIYVLHMGF